VGRYLEPIVAVRHDGKYWTPNGSHRLSTAKAMGMKSIVALVMPEPEVALPDLALKHREGPTTSRSAPWRSSACTAGWWARAAARRRASSPPSSRRPPSRTLGAPTRSGRALRRRLQPGGAEGGGVLRPPLTETLKTREAHAEDAARVDDVVVGIVDALKKKGLGLALPQELVVARINPLKGTAGPARASSTRSSGRCWSRRGGSTSHRSARRTVGDGRGTRRGGGVRPWAKS
jgi:ParB family chromosome partitioning protein